MTFEGDVNGVEEAEAIGICYSQFKIVHSQIVSTSVIWSIRIEDDGLITQEDNQEFKTFFKSHNDLQHGFLV